MPMRNLTFKCTINYCALLLCVILFTQCGSKPEPKLDTLEGSYIVQGEERSSSSGYDLVTMQYTTSSSSNTCEDYELQVELVNLHGEDSEYIGTMLVTINEEPYGEIQIEKRQFEDIQLNRYSFTGNYSTGYFYPADSIEYGIYVPRNTSSYKLDLAGSKQL